jgi:hypothetical protein
MRMLVLVLLVGTSPWIVHPRTILPASSDVIGRGDLTLRAVPTLHPARSTISTGNIGIETGSEYGPMASRTVNEQETVSLDPTATEEVVEGSLLPEHRILLIYGLPGDASYGMLANYDNLRLLEFLRGKIAEYQALDPNRPIIIGLQVVASAAQKTPGSDGSYLRDTSVTTIYQYIEFTRAHRMLLFLDVQIGRRIVPDDVQRMGRYLQEPHVHLGIDPEFDVGRTEIPTQDIGKTTAADIRWVQEYLAGIAFDFGLPPKILIVHQFTDEMVVNRPLLRPVHGVQLVMNVSLWGNVDQKTAAYRALVADNPIEFGGIMISGAWDSPPMTVEDVINLPNAPAVVIYQ